MRNVEINPVRARRLTFEAGSKLAAEAVGRILQFVLIYLVQRSLGPALYGDFTFAVAVGFVLAPFTDLGMQLIVTRELARDAASAPPIAGTSLIVKLILTSIASGCVLILSGTRAPAVQAATFALGLSVILNAFVEFFGYVFRGLQHVELDAALSLITRVLVFGLGLIALASRSGLTGLAGAYAVGSGLAAVIGYTWLHRKFFKPDLTFNRQTIQHLLKMALPLGGAIVISIAYTRTSIFMLDAFSNSVAVGVYGVAQKFVEPLSIVPAAIMAAIFPALTQDIARTGYAATRRLRYRTIGLLALAGAAIAAGGVIGGPWLIQLLYTDASGGNPYAGSILPLQLLALNIPITFVNYALTHYLIALGKQRLNLKFTSIMFVINAMVCWLLIPRIGLAGAAIATLVSECALLSLCARALR